MISENDKERIKAQYRDGWDRDGILCDLLAMEEGNLYDYFDKTIEKCIDEVSKERK